MAESRTIVIDWEPPSTIPYVALDAVFDSVSIGVTFTKELAKFGIIFCPISEAVKLYPELVYLYLGKIVSMGDNYYSALNSAVFSDGSQLTNL